MYCTIMCVIVCVCRELVHTFEPVVLHCELRLVTHVGEVELLVVEQLAVRGVVVRECHRRLARRAVARAALRLPELLPPFAYTCTNPRKSKIIDHFVQMGKQIKWSTNKF